MTPVIEARRLQAQVVKPIYETLVAELGVERARAILEVAIRKAAIGEGQALAGASTGTPDLPAFIALFEHWTTGGALEITVHEASAERFDFDVTRCRYAEMYREMGLDDIGHLLSCNRDGAFIEGYNPAIRLRREQTIMGGAPCCTFRYARTDGPET